MIQLLATVFSLWVAAGMLTVVAWNVVKAWAPYV